MGCTRRRFLGLTAFHQAFEGIMTVDEAVRRSAEYLRSVIA